MMPKSKGNAYFIACRKGASESRRELGVKLIWDGPPIPIPPSRTRVVETWITRGVDVIAVAAENREGISTVLRKARKRGIKVITWDADAEPDARDFLVNQATPQGIGNTLMDHAGRMLGGKGEFAIITASLTAANQIEWQKYIEARRQEKISGHQDGGAAPLRRPAGKGLRRGQHDPQRPSQREAHHGHLLARGAGAAEAVKQSRRMDVKVIGLGLPNDNKRYVHEGITKADLWNTKDLGYLTVYVAKALANGTLKPGTTTLEAGRLDPWKSRATTTLSKKPFISGNIDQLNFSMTQQAERRGALLSGVGRH